jgi:DNA-binding transcriptional LysR family regulator
VTHGRPPRDPVDVDQPLSSTLNDKTVVALPKDNALAGKAQVELKALAPMFFIGMSETSYPGYRDWLVKACQRAAFTPKVLQDVDLERKMIHAVAAGLGVANRAGAVKKLEYENVVFRSLDTVIITEGCVAWRNENPSAALQAYVRIVEQAGSSLR